MIDTPITRAEHEEFSQRIEERDRRQDKRLELLEENTKQQAALTTSVEKLALSIESMCKEQERQGARLEMLEARDGEMWRTVSGYIITAIVGIVVGFIFTHIGL